MDFLDFEFIDFFFVVDHRFIFCSFDIIIAFENLFIDLFTAIIASIIFIYCFNLAFLKSNEWV